MFCKKYFLRQKLIIISRGTSRQHNGKEKEGSKEDKEAKGFKEEASIVQPRRKAKGPAPEKTLPQERFFLVEMW